MGLVPWRSVSLLQLSAGAHTVRIHIHSLITITDPPINGGINQQGPGEKIKGWRGNQREKRFILVFGCLVLSVFSTIPAHQEFSSHCLLIL
ncbi:potassium voltage-gated channel subfamily KQT member 5-like protein, partial [Lates japonicus]